MKTLLFAFLMMLSTQALAIDKQIGAGDMLQISIYGNPDLSTQVRVTNSGIINFPLIGEVNVSNKSVPEAERLIASELEKKGFLRKPQVNIIVTEFVSQEVSVLGDVVQPGRIALLRATTITDLLANAGGISPAGSDLITIISKKNGKSTETNIDLRDILENKQKNIDIFPGDIVFVHGDQVSVLGKVAKPGKYSIKGSSRTVVDFLSLAGGITPDGADSVTVIKKGPSGQKKYTIDMDLLFHDGTISKNMELTAGAIIYVPRRPVFYIYGEVNRSGSYSLERNMTIAQALAVGGGVSAKGTENRIVIKRRNSKGGTDEIPVEASTLLMENDVIYVKESLF